MERWSIVVQGVVQGVGFRPFVYRLATHHGLGGFVRNRTGSVVIEAEGEPSSLQVFLAELTERPPPLALIERLTWERCRPRGEGPFRVKPSEDDAASPVFISPDVATCADCLAELLDPADRRHGYAFLNCTHCGPRLTIITGAPYDRPRTTMARFTMCAACRSEYEDPANRRFHAQPIACPSCGPRLQALDASGRPVTCEDPLATFCGALLDGKLGAVKGLGGFHLACDARNPQAVAELRRRKHRDEKPFAVMVPDITMAAALCEIGATEEALLRSPQCPIVVLRRRATSTIAEGVAPRNPWLGLMLPYTPLHHRLMRAVGGIPLVMTSGNRSDEPIAYREDAPEKLSGIPDVFLVHDRPIHVRCDDSVTRVVAGAELPVRRSRGYAPRPIELPNGCAVPLLALGGQLKNTFALGRDRQAILSHHMGDLDHYDAYRAFVRDIELYQRLFAVRPTHLAHDLHPDYATTRYARERASQEAVTLIAVQHHHAHMASCIADNGLDEPVIGVAFDGTGYGTDGAIWGGEFLVGDARGYQRAAYLRYVGMPGGERAIQEPWRMALAHLVDAGADLAAIQGRVSSGTIRLVRKMLETRLYTPPTSSIGRLFDAVASLAGVRDRVSHEGQAAMELEWFATGVAPEPGYPFELGSPPVGAGPGTDLIIDTRPLIRAVVDDVARGVEAARIARRFHSALVDLIASACIHIRATRRIDAVALSGGVFLNALLTSEVIVRLRGEGFRVYRHRQVPTNDGGLSLGQLAVAAAITGSAPPWGGSRRDT
jgi:hydrogenase maturation protein HypF